MTVYSVIMYSEACINRSCSDVETLLERTGTFDPVCFLYASLSRISKAGTVKRALLQTNEFFQSSDKKVNCLTRTQIKVLGILEKKRIILDIFVNFFKMKLFFSLFKTVFFFISFCSFWSKAILLSINTTWSIVSNNFCRY